MQQLSNTLSKIDKKDYDTQDLKKLDPIDFQILVHNEGIGHLKHLDCPLCKNKGDIAVRIDGYMQIVPCQCMNERRIMQRMNDSGLNSQFANYRFDNFKTSESWQKSLKEVVMDYIEHFTEQSPHKWLFLGGQVGSGKTHLISASMLQLTKKGYDIAYMQYSEEMPRIEMALTSFNPDEKTLSTYERFKRVQILVIDDAFKNYTKQRAFWDIINHRYKDPKLVTIVSSQYHYDALVQITGDESLPSRIFERCSEKYFKEIKFDDSRNYRMKGTVV